MNIVKVKIDEVKPNPKNPRTIRDDKFKKLVESIRTFPQMLEIRPIVVDKEGFVLGGNMRYKACKEAGLEEIHIIRADYLTEEQIREFTIKDNVNYGEWDYMLLTNKNDLESWGMDLPDWEVSQEADVFFDELLEDWEDDKDIEIETETKPSNTNLIASYIMLFLEKEDYEWIKLNEDILLEKIGKDNLSDAFYHLLKNNI